MKFLDLARLRCSVRAYAKKAVEREKVLRCIEAARLAPSACNSQPWHFIVVDDPELKEKISRETLLGFSNMNRFTTDAPLLVAIVVEKSNFAARVGGLIKQKDYSLFDVGIAAEHFCLQAAEEGLGTCMLGWFDIKAVKKLLGVPKNREVGLLISVGYTDEKKPRDKKRKAIEEIHSFNKYQK